MEPESSWGIWDLRSRSIAESHPSAVGWSWSNFWDYYLGQAQSSHLLAGESRRSVLKLYLLVHSHLVQGIEDLMEIPGGREGNRLGVQSRRCRG